MTPFDGLQLPLPTRRYPSMFCTFCYCFPVVPLLKILMTQTMSPSHSDSFFFRPGKQQILHSDRRDAVSFTLPYQLIGSTSKTLTQELIHANPPVPHMKQSTGSHHNNPHSTHCFSPPILDIHNLLHQYLPDVWTALVHKGQHIIHRSVLLQWKPSLDWIQNDSW